MANSRYEYVKKFELDDTLLPGCWIVVRLDGKGFTKFAEEHHFVKPNDVAALELMDRCAQAVLLEFSDIRIAYGVSDEYSFVLHKNTSLYGHYVQLWPLVFPGRQLSRPPMFDGRAVCYPTDAMLRDYLAWRQVDTHINNQYNTCFWALVKDGKTPKEAQAVLKGTQADFKNELLFRQYGMNYNDLPARVRKGSVIIRQLQAAAAKARPNGAAVQRTVTAPLVMHVDIIRDDFWRSYPEVLA